MATPTLPPDDVRHLKGFTQLGPQILYYKPSSSNSTQTSTDRSTPQPDLIVICSWMYAFARHIAKYTESYKTIYPSSPILLLRSQGSDITWRPDSWQQEAMQPACQVIHDLVKSSPSTVPQDSNQKSPHPRVLMHVSSNGGVYTVHQLSRAYTSQTPSTLLPMTSLILDSCPGSVSLSIGVSAYSQGLPPLPVPFKTFAQGLIASFLLLARGVRYLPGPLHVPDGLTQASESLNDPAGPFCQSTVKNRVYIYSETDELIPWRDVEAHAARARETLAEKGSGTDKTVVLEKFVGSAHVGHVMKDPERYWGIVKKTWEDAVRDE